MLHVNIVGNVKQLYVLISYKFQVRCNNPVKVSHYGPYKWSLILSIPHWECFFLPLC